jgi:hypothetical protein
MKKRIAEQLLSSETYWESRVLETGVEGSLIDEDFKRYFQNVVRARYREQEVRLPDFLAYPLAGSCIEIAF